MGLKGLLWGLFFADYTTRARFLDIGRHVLRLHHSVGGGDRPKGCGEGNAKRVIS